MLLIDLPVMFLPTGILFDDTKHIQTANRQNPASMACDGAQQIPG